MNFDSRMYAFHVNINRKSTAHPFNISCQVPDRWVPTVPSQLPAAYTFGNFRKHTKSGWSQPSATCSAPAFLRKRPCVIEVCMHTCATDMLTWHCYCYLHESGYWLPGPPNLSTRQHVPRKHLSCFYFCSCAGDVVTWCNFPVITSYICTRQQHITAVTTELWIKTKDCLVDVPRVGKQRECKLKGVLQDPQSLRFSIMISDYIVQCFLSASRKCPC